MKRAAQNKLTNKQCDRAARDIVAALKNWFDINNSDEAKYVFSICLSLCDQVTWTNSYEEILKELGHVKK
jgi:hypothetical protein